MLRHGVFVTQISSTSPVLRQLVEGTERTCRYPGSLEELSAEEGLQLASVLTGRAAQNDGKTGSATEPPKGKRGQIPRSPLSLFAERGETSQLDFGDKRRIRLYAQSRTGRRHLL